VNELTLYFDAFDQIPERTQGDYVLKSASRPAKAPWTTKPWQAVYEREARVIPLSEVIDQLQSRANKFGLEGTYVLDELVTAIRAAQEELDTLREKRSVNDVPIRISDSHGEADTLEDVAALLRQEMPVSIIDEDFAYIHVTDMERMIAAIEAAQERMGRLEEERDGFMEALDDARATCRDKLRIADERIVRAETQNRHYREALEAIKGSGNVWVYIARHKGVMTQLERDNADWTKAAMSIARHALDGRAVHEPDAEHDR